MPNLTLNSPAEQSGLVRFSPKSGQSSHLETANEAIRQLSEAQGFSQVPNILLDMLRGILKRNEYDVFMYLVRRTLGFHKLSDAISMNQFLNGIVTREGKRLDFGCGVKSADTVSRALRELERLGFITRQHVQSPNGASASNLYTLLPINILQAISRLDNPVNEINQSNKEVENVSSQSIGGYLGNYCGQKPAPTIKPHFYERIPENLNTSTNTAKGLEVKTSPPPENEGVVNDNRGDKTVVLQNKETKPKEKNHGAMPLVDGLTLIPAKQFVLDTALLETCGFDKATAMFLAKTAEQQGKTANYIAEIITYSQKYATANPCGMIRRLIEQGQERNPERKSKPAPSTKLKSKLQGTFQKVALIGELEPSIIWQGICQRLLTTTNQPYLAGLLADTKLERLETETGQNQVTCWLTPKQAWQKRLFSPASVSLIEMALSQKLGKIARVQFTC
jgi:hypothetical protein